ncbi:hypothetical protein PMIT1342_00549 [Prochlorococcus marinus str. MIT 1342]|nr:hypothetical protein PMIT1342_00549 [Prochlorococcus marinus str. MIT 1342]
MDDFHLYINIRCTSIVDMIIKLFSEKDSRRELGFMIIYKQWLA